MANPLLIIKENDLRDLLGGVSRAALYVWRRRGLPVVSDGGPGRAPTYDMVAVSDWLRLTGFGLRMANGRSVDLRALQIEIERRAPGGAVATSGRPSSPAPSPPTPAAARAASRQEYRQELGVFLGEMFNRGMPGWAPFIMARYNIDGAIAIELLQDLLLFLASEAGELLLIEEPDDFEFLYPDWMDQLKDPDSRAAILSRLKATADVVRRELAAAGEASGA